LPIYEYECTCCSSRFELKQSFSESTVSSCPQCGGKAQRIFSPVPIIFKGPGFYSTDNRGTHGHSSHEDRTDKAKAGSRENDKRSSHKGGTDEAKAGSTDKGS